MITKYDELDDKSETIRKLQVQIGLKDKKIFELLKDKEIYLNRALLSESEILPVRKALNALTAEKSKWLRKQKKLKNSDETKYV
jgi:transcriptional regulator of met regulon